MTVAGYEDVVSALVGVRAALAATVEAEGLQLEQVTLQLPEAGGPLEAQVLVSLPDGWGRDEVAARFDEVVAGAHQAEVEQQAEAARAELAEGLRQQITDEGFL